MRQDCASALVFLLLQRKAEKDGRSAVKVAWQQDTESPGPLGTPGLGQPSLTNAMAMSGLWSPTGVLKWEKKQLRSSCMNVALLCDEWISSNMIYEMTKWGQSGKWKAGAGLCRRAWLKDNPVGSNCGNAAVMKRGWTFYERLGKNRKDKAIVSLFPGAWRVKKVKRRAINFSKTLVVWILFKAWINPSLTWK